MEFKNFSLGDLCLVKSSKRIYAKEYVEVGIPFYRSKEIIQLSEGENISTDLFISPERFNELNSKFGSPKIGDILITSVGTIGVPYLVDHENFYFKDGNLTWLSEFDERINNLYIYYWLTSRVGQNEIEKVTIGSTQKALTIVNLKSINIKVPPLKIQNKITEILSLIDNKLQINRESIANLEELSQTLFKRWFVDFEFPNKEGNSYKTYRGKMIQSELGEIPERWQVLRLEDIAHSYNTVRKPLSKLEREKQENNYPYYGATKIIDYVGNYLFDGKYILVGEDGTVKTDEGTPFTQYIWGQFWVSNHAHVLKGKTISDELLLLNLKNVYIEPFITGAVQPKLNKKNLNSIKFLQADESTLSKFERIIQPIYGKVRELTDESNYLRELRDTLLPKLMSGEIELPDELEVDKHAELLQ